MKLVAYVRSHAGAKCADVRKQEDAIYKLLVEDPNRCASKLAKLMHLPKHIVSRRLEDLSRQGKIKYVKM